MKLRFILLFVFCFLSAQVNSNEQLWYGRVQDAKHATDSKLRSLFREKNLTYPPQRLFLRVFKSENALEVWASDNSKQAFTLVKTYQICAMSGQLGPKRKEGDEQVPEGFYQISTLNPYSAYHLSMQVSYPNQSDRLLSKNSRLGGDIYIHGDCKSIGCIAITDPKIEEVYWLVAQARANGQSRVPVHLFPSRMSDLKYNILCRLYRDQPSLLRFWNGLKQGYDFFEKNHILPTVQVTDNGFYQIN